MTIRRAAASSGADRPDAGLPEAGPYDARYYAANRQAHDRPALRWYARLVRRYGGPGPYLDFGCGTGHLLRRLATLGPAAGFEVSPFAAATARRSAACAVYERLDDLPSRGFGVVVAVHVLEHLTDETVAATLTAWRRVLRPDGRALVVTPDAAGRGRALAGPRWVGHADATHVNLQSHAQWRRLLSAHGFAVVREGSDGLWDVPYGRRLGPSDVGRAAPALAQYLAGRLLLPPGAGESAVLVVRRHP